jgi:hypothetical protein
LCSRRISSIVVEVDRSAIAIVLVVGGCFSPQPITGAPCSSNDTCPSSLTCVAGRCVPPGTAADALSDGPAPDVMIDAASDAMPDASTPLPRLVQQATNYATPATTVTATFQASPTVGNILVAVGGCPQGSLASIAGAATTWQRAVFSAINANIEVHVAVANGERSVTIGLPACTSYMSLSISEWENIAMSPVDQVGYNDGLASPASAGSIAIASVPRLVLFSVASYTPNTFGTPSDGPWSELVPIDEDVEMRTWYRVVTTPGTLAPTVTETRHEWDATLVSLKVN